MSKSSLVRLFVLATAVLILLVACRRGEEVTPTAEPAAPAEAVAEPTAVPTEPPASEEVAPEAAAEPTATTEPETAEPIEADWPPQVVASEPLFGQELALDSTFTVRFDQPMDQNSVEDAWAIEPAVEGQFSWPRPDTVLFTPQKELERNAQYRVRIADSATATNGLTLAEPFEFASNTLGDLQVTQVIPEDGARNVQTHGAVTVVFNRPVVPLTSSDQQANLPQPLVFDPPVEGEGKWVSTSIYRFEPGSAGLAGGTSYRVTVEEGLADVSGAVLPADYSWQFDTQNPELVMVSPPNGAMLVPPTRPISITFNMPMDRAATEAAISLNPAAALDFEWKENDTLVVATPQEGLALETSYALSIAQSATAANGQAGMARPATSAFTVVPFPAVKQTYPSNGEIASPFQRGVSIEFVSAMDEETLIDRVLISPEPEEVTYSYNAWIDEFDPSFSSFNLYIDFGLERNTEYVVTIPADAADPYGNTLGEDYVLRFESPGFVPLASLNLPRPLSQVSTSFPTDVEIIHRNVSRLDVELYQPATPLEGLVDLYNFDQGTPLGRQLRTWTVPLETPQDEIDITTVSLADGGALPTGVYVLTVNAPEVDPDNRYWQNQRHVLVVADTNIVVSEMPDEVHVWVTDLQSGEPAANRPVVIYDFNRNEIGSAVTDSNGFAGFDYDPVEEYQRNVTAVTGDVGQPGFGMASSAWIGETNVWNLGINYGYGPAQAQYSYLYTDRPIYRPGDTVYFKGILRENNYGRYALPEEQTLTLTLGSFSFFDPESSLEETIEVTVNADGLYWGEYTLPEDAPLGTYNFMTQSPDLDLFRSFTVAEYRKPEFQVTLTPASQEKLRGETAEVTLEATYFFGGTAEGLEVQWIAYQDAYVPTVPGPFYAFGDQGGFNFIYYGPFGRPFGGMYGPEVANGISTTDENGQLTIALPADLLDDVEEGSRKVTIEARVTDITNFPVTTTAAVIFHAADAYIGVRTNDFATPAGTEATVDLLSVDWDGEAVGNQDVEVVFFRREWERSRNDDFGMYITEWTPVDTEVDRMSVTTNASGKAQASFVPEDGGEYLAVATLTDGNGRQQTSSIGLWIIDENYAGWRTDPRQRTMDLEPEQTDYQVGNTARILVQSPFTGPAKAWLLIERGNMVEQQVVTIEGGNTVLELPVKPEYAPNVYVSVFAIKPVTPDSDFPYADVRMGITELKVAPDQFDLQVSLTPRATEFEPGDAAVFDVLVTDKQGNPVSADFSLALVDLAVLTLKEDNAPPILEAFYSPQLYRSQVGTGLFISGEGLEAEVPLEGGGFGGGGGGDVAEAAVARLEDEEGDETRAEFPDTAFWEASVQTDASGTAVVEIPLPDSLTTWRLSSKAITNETQVGQGSAEVVVSLPLLVRPVTPRFFTVGDIVQLGAVVNNNTDSSIEATVSLETDGLTLSGASEQLVTVEAGRSQLVRWEVTVEDVPFADLTFRVEGGGYSDATKPTVATGPDNMIPVYRYDAQDFTGTAGELDEAGRRVEAILLPPNVDPRRGSVEVKLSASLAAAMLDALEVLEKEEIVPACAQDATDRLLANLATEKVIQQLDLERGDLTATLAEIIPQDIGTLEKQQNRGGGWGWCYDEDSDPWLSAYALLALARAQDNGHDVDTEVIDSAQSYLKRQLEDMDQIADRGEANRQAFFLYVLAEAGEDVVADLDALVDEHRGLMDPYAKALLVMAYDALDVASANLETLLADLNDQAIVSASGAHWQDAEADYFNLSSDVRGTAMVISALARVQPDNVLAPAAVRWLMLARTAEIWSTPHETAWSISALGDWMAVSGELEANYDYQLDLNGTPFADGSFNCVERNADCGASESLSVPVGNLNPTESNFFDFQRGEGDGRLYYTMFLNSFVSADAVEATSRGITVTRAYYDAACDAETETCEPIDEIEAGQQVRVELTIIAPTDLLYAVLEDPIPAGAEGIDPGLDISSSGFEGGVERVDESFRYGYWGWWYFNHIEYRDEKVVFLSSFLPAGTYQYTYYLQANIPGKYQAMPAVGYQEFFPDVFGRSNGQLFTITGE